MVKLVHSYSGDPEIPCFYRSDDSSSYLKTFITDPYPQSSSLYYCWPTDPQPLQGTWHWSPNYTCQKHYTPLRFSVEKIVYIYFLVASTSFPPHPDCFWRPDRSPTNRYQKLCLQRYTLPITATGYCWGLKGIASDSFPLWYRGSAILRVWDSSVCTVTRLRSS